MIKRAIIVIVSAVASLFGPYWLDRSIDGKEEFILLQWGHGVMLIAICGVIIFVLSVIIFCLYLYIRYGNE